MSIELLNDGQPDDEGMIRAVIRNADGKITSEYKAKNERELILTTLKSQENANKEIARLRKPDAARPTLTVEPKELTAADRLRLSSEITDPNRVVEAVDEIITARQGIAPDRLGAEFARKSREEQDEFYAQEAEAFVNEHPDYYPVPQNQQALFEALKANRWELTRNNLAIAFDTLKEQGRLIDPPNEQQDSESQTEPNAHAANGNGQALTPRPRPRTIATTGLRNADASATRPAPQPKKQQYTRADIERMSRAEYTEKLNSDPDFRRQVDAM